jgi:GTP-binding protein
MSIKNSRFLVSNQSISKCPPPNKPEFAFIGRSNVGKSSLINMLCQSKSLAKTSSTPGKTQLINHFIINNAWYLVDLPGYGYAKLSKSKKETFGKMIMDYLTHRESLMCLFILVDSRLEPQPIDLQFMQQMGTMGMPFAIVLTKVDKLSKTVFQAQVDGYKQKLLEDWEELPPMFITSATKREGRDEIVTYIEAVIKNWDPARIKKNITPPPQDSKKI